MSRILKDIGFSKIYFYNSRHNGSLDAPMIALIPFVNFLIPGDDAGLLPNLDRLIMEARARHIPVIQEECVGKLGSICDVDAQYFQ